MTRTRVSLLAAPLALVLVLCGCNSPHNPGESSVTEAEVVAKLKDRPDSEQAIRTYNKFVDTLRAELSDAGVVGKWKKEYDGTPDYCGDFGGQPPLNAETRSTPDWSADGITEDNWPKAWEIVARLADANGFTTKEVVKDQPGDHDIFFKDSYGAVMEFGTKVNTVIGLRSGCHLKPAGSATTPLPPPPSL